MFQPPCRAPRVPRKCLSVLTLDIWSSFPDTLELAAATLLLERTGHPAPVSSAAVAADAFPVARLFHDDDGAPDADGSGGGLTSGGAAAAAAAATAAASFALPESVLGGAGVVLCPVPCAPLRLQPGRNRVPVSVGPLEAGRYALGWLTASWGNATVVVRARPDPPPPAPPATGSNNDVLAVASLAALRQADCWRVFSQSSS